MNRPGAFAEYLTLPAGNLHPVPAAVGDDGAVFAEPLAAALEIQEQVKIAPADRVMVVGDGKLGLLIAQTLALTGCDLLVVGRHDAKLALLRARGIRTDLAGTIRAGAFDVVIVVKEVTLVGSRCGPFPPALELLAGGRVDVASLVHARYPLSDGLEAFTHAARPGVLKVLLDVD